MISSDGVTTTKRQVPNFNHFRNLSPHHRGWHQDHQAIRVIRVIIRGGSEVVDRADSQEISSQQQSQTRPSRAADNSQQADAFKSAPAHTDDCQKIFLWSSDSAWRVQLSDPEQWITELSSRPQHHTLRLWRREQGERLQHHLASLLGQRSQGAGQAGEVLQQSQDQVQQYSTAVFELFHPFVQTVSHFADVRKCQDTR